MERMPYWFSIENTIKLGMLIRARPLANCARSLDIFACVSDDTSRCRKLRLIGLTSSVASRVSDPSWAESRPAPYLVGVRVRVRVRVRVGVGVGVGVRVRATG